MLTKSKTLSLIQEVIEEIEISKSLISSAIENKYDKKKAAFIELRGYMSEIALKMVLDPKVKKCICDQFDDFFTGYFGKEVMESILFSEEQNKNNLSNLLTKMQVEFKGKDDIVDVCNDMIETYHIEIEHFEDLDKDICGYDVNVDLSVIEKVKQRYTDADYEFIIHGYSWFKMIFSDLDKKDKINIEKAKEELDKLSKSKYWSEKTRISPTAFYAEHYNNRLKIAGIKDFINLEKLKIKHYNGLVQSIESEKEKKEMTADDIQAKAAKMLFSKIKKSRQNEACVFAEDILKYAKKSELDEIASNISVLVSRMQISDKIINGLNKELFSVSTSLDKLKGSFETVRNSGNSFQVGGNKLEAALKKVKGQKERSKVISLWADQFNYNYICKGYFFDPFVWNTAYNAMIYSQLKDCLNVELNNIVVSIFESDIRLDNEEMNNAILDEGIKTLIRLNESFTTYNNHIEIDNAVSEIQEESNYSSQKSSSENGFNSTDEHNGLSAGASSGSYNKSESSDFNSNSDSSPSSVFNSD